MSNWENLRKFHNKIKIDLITHCSLDSHNLLDVSVGRGGDIQKWYNVNIKNVYGIDPNEKFIKEAIKRYVKMKNKLKNTNYRFEVNTITSPNCYIKDKYDITSCQFTLHYFFKSDEMLEIAIRNIASATTKWFIGTTIIGERLKTEKNENYSIEIFDDGSYSFKLHDSQSSGNYFNEDELKEYLVDFEKFEKLCNKYGLVLHSRVPFSSIDKRDFVLQEHELAISNLYDMFVFKKLTT